jgi:membrane protein
VLVAAGFAFFERRLTQNAAAIAYRVLFSLAPLAIVLVFALGLVLRDESLRADVVDRVVGWLPVTDEGGDSVEDAITRLAEPTSVVGLIPLVTFFWAASGMMAALRNGLETALAVEGRRDAARGKLVDLALVVGAGLLVLVAIALTLAAQVASSIAGGIAEVTGFGNGTTDRILGVGVPIAVALLTVVLLYRFVPSRRLGMADTIVGAIVTAILLVGISKASALVFDGAARLSAIYGSITVVLVFLYSIYLYASAILFGAVVASLWSVRGDLSTRGRLRDALPLFVVRRLPPPRGRGQ